MQLVLFQMFLVKSSSLNKLVMEVLLGVVMESVVATVIANEMLEKFSSDNLEELKAAVASHRDYVKNF
jgi:hypothetical protein